MEPVPFDSKRWTWDTAEPPITEHLGRECVRLQDTTGTVVDAEFVDGTVEAELAVAPERGFHGVAWRARDGENFESFFVRPHQVGNPDAVQYTPVFNGLGGFQLYHGDGYWAPVAFPLDEWFRIRVVFGGERAEVYVADLNEPVLTIRSLERPVTAGKVGVFAGGAPVHVAGFAFDSTGRTPFRRPPPPPAPILDGIIPAWWISDAFPEEVLAGVQVLDDGLFAPRTWSRLDSGPSGLVDLARVNGVRDGRNTAFARATIRSAREQTAEIQLGFSDRAAVYLNGRLLYRGDDTYRSRDYRFLGSIGYFDRLYLPLLEGENELVVAVSEDFGGWGVQARFPDVATLEWPGA